MKLKGVRFEFVITGIIFYINVLFLGEENHYTRLITPILMLVLLFVWTAGKLDDLRVANLYKLASRLLKRGSAITSNFEGLKNLYKRNIVIEEEGFVIEPKNIKLDFLAKDNIEEILLSLYYPFASKDSNNPYRDDYRLRYCLRTLVGVLGNEELDRLTRTGKYREFCTYKAGGINHSVFDVSFDLDNWKPVEYRVGDPSCLLELVESEKLKEMLTDLALDATTSGNTIISFIDKSTDKYAGSITIEWKVVKNTSKCLSTLKTLGKNVIIVSRNIKPTEIRLEKTLDYDKVYYGIIESFPSDVCNEDNMILTRTLRIPSSLEKSTMVFSAYDSKIKAKKFSNLHEYVDGNGLVKFTRLLVENWEIEQLSRKAREYLDAVIPSLMILLGFISCSRYSGWRGEITAFVLGLVIVFLNFLTFLRTDMDSITSRVKPFKEWMMCLKWILPVFFLVTCIMMKGEKMHNVFLIWMCVACNIPSWIYKNSGTLSMFLVPLACFVMVLSFLILC